MKSNLPFILALIVLALPGWSVAKETGVVAAGSGPRPWASEASDIEPDAKLIRGRLDNGMRYVILANPKPPGRASLRLHIAAGSLMEADNQRGVAHFLEHMVFNGSHHFPDADQLIPKMQRLGIAFGAHANAYTSFDETVYMLDLPNMDPDTLELAFDVMHDFADGAMLETSEIDKERGVILSEKTSRDSVQMRLMEKQFEYLLPDALLAKRFPIGIEEIVGGAPRERFTDFYHRYYVPERMTFVYVGDFDADEAERRVRATFGAMRPPSNPGADPEMGGIPSGTGFRTVVFADDEVAATDLTLMTMRPYQRVPDTRANRGEKRHLAVAYSILNRRFSILAKKEGSPITSGTAMRQRLFDFVDLNAITVMAADHQWKAAVPVLEQELRRAVEFGFTEGELAQVKANLINQAEQAVKAAPSRKSPALASSLAKHVHLGAVFSTPEDDLAILRENLAAVTLESCHAAIKKTWDTPDLTLVLTSKTNPDGAEAELGELFERSRAVVVDPPEKADAGQFGYTDFGPPGEVKQRHQIEDLGITQLVFSNGVRVNFKTTDFKKNSISLTARIGAGKLTQPMDKPGLDVFASAVFTAGGLGKHSSDDLQRLLAGRNAKVGFAVGDDAFVFSGGTTPDDLELELQLLCAYLTDPGFRPEAERQFKKQLPAIFARMEHTPAGPMSKIQAYLRGDDARFVFPTPEQAEALSSGDARGWIVPALESGYGELSIVGDIDPEKLVPLLAKTIGALPTRADRKPPLGAERTLNLPSPPAEKHYAFDSKIPTGLAMVAWKGPGLGDDNIGEVRRLDLVASILTNRMREKLREELGEAYSPRSRFDPSDTFKDLGYLMAFSQGKPEQAESVGKLILEIGSKLAAEGSTADELDRALKPALGMMEKSLRDNGYWLNTVMSRSQEEPHRIDWARKRDEDYKNIKLEEINTLARKYLGTPNAFRIEVVPEG